VQLILRSGGSEAELEAWSKCRTFYSCLFIQVQLKNALREKKEKRLNIVEAMEKIGEDFS